MNSVGEGFGLCENSGDDRLASDGQMNNPDLCMPATRSVNGSMNVQQREEANECWEFKPTVVGANKFIKRFTTRDGVRKALQEGDIGTSWCVCRRSAHGETGRDAADATWTPIPDSLYQELGLSREVLVRAEKAFDRKWTLVGCTTLLVLGARHFSGFCSTYPPRTARTVVSIRNIAGR